MRSSHFPGLYCTLIALQRYSDIVMLHSNQIKFVYCDTDNHNYLQFIIGIVHCLLEALSLFIRIPGTCPEYMHHRKILGH
jgi:hypothetical protein